MTIMPLLTASCKVAFRPLTSPGLTRIASTFLLIRFCSCWIWPATSVSALSITSSLVTPLSMYSLLVSISSWIICVRYSLLMKGFEIPMVNFLPGAAAAVLPAAVVADSVAAAVIAGDSVAAAVIAGISVAATVIAGASVAAAVMAGASVAAAVAAGISVAAGAGALVAAGAGALVTTGAVVGAGAVVAVVDVVDAPQAASTDS